MKLFPKGTTGIVKKGDKCFAPMGTVISTEAPEIPDEIGYENCNQCQGVEFISSDLIETCYSDDFNGDSIDSKWGLILIGGSPTVTQSGGTLNIDSDAGTECAGVEQTGHNISGDFKASALFPSIDVGASGGHDVGLSINIGGTIYQFVFRQNSIDSTTRGFYKRVGSTSTLLQADLSSTKSNQRFTLERDGSNNLKLILNGVTLDTIAGVTGSLTSVAIVACNFGAGASGNVSSTTDEFILESPIGTPYCD